MHRAAQSGFSLIETLVAMTILAVSSTAILSATETHTRAIAAVSDRTVARWVASNTIVAVAQGQAAPERVDMGRSGWQVRVDRKETGDPALNRVDVAVARAEAPNVVLARLTGFVDTASGAAE